MVTGATALAEYARVVAAKYNVTVALHTDHCPAGQARRVPAPAAGDLARAGRPGRGAAVPVAHVRRLRRAAGGEPRISSELMEKSAEARVILEIEIGVVGGEEDGVSPRDQRQALHHARRRHRDRRVRRPG